MQELEFYGGPFDGHRECLDAGRPAERLAWLVCDSTLGILSGKRNTNLGVVTSVAIYELEVADGEFRYDYSFSVSFKDLRTSPETRSVQIRKGRIHDK